MPPQPFPVSAKHFPGWGEIMMSKKKPRKRKSKPEISSPNPGDKSAEQNGPVPSVPVVGICSSAGGLDALTRFFKAAPSESGVAFVVVPHLDPTHESLMVELLGRHTAMPIAQVEEGMEVEADHVYVIPDEALLVGCRADRARAGT